MDLFKKCINFKNHHFFIFSIAFTLLNEIKDTGKQNIQIGQCAVGCIAVRLQLVIYLVAVVSYLRGSTLLSILFFLLSPDWS